MILHADLDDNGKKDYWTADFFGVIALQNPDAKTPKEIDIDIAKADAAPAKTARPWKIPAKAPRLGYYFKAMTVDQDGQPYQQDEDGDGNKWTNPSRFAFCAYPAKHGKSGFRTFIVSEEGVVYGKDMEGKAVDRWPGVDPTALPPDVRKGKEYRWHITE